MFIGHYAVALGLTALSEDRKGILTYLSTASVLPDVFMLGSYQLGVKLNFHADWGLLLCLSVILLYGKLLKANLSLYQMGVLALILHLLTDIPYSAQDATNLYAHPSVDFAIETCLLLGATVLYVRRQLPKSKRRVALIGLTSLLLLFQAAWNFGMQWQ